MCTSMCTCHDEKGDEMTMCEALKKFSLSFWYETLAQMFLVVLACGVHAHTTSVDANGVSTAPYGAMGLALVYGLIYTALLYMLSHRSGGHVNPAVTLCYMLTGDCNRFEGLVILIGQALGAVAGGFVLSLTFPKDASDAIGATTISGDWDDDAGYPRVALAEGIAMFMVLCVYYEAGVNNYSLARTEHDRRPVMAPVAIGCAYFAAYMFTIPITGGSLNPAKSLATALWATLREADNDDKIWEDVWFFLIGQGIAVAAQFVFIRLQRVKGFASDPNDRDAGMRSNSMYMNNLEDVEDVEVDGGDVGDN